MEVISTISAAAVSAHLYTNLLLAICYTESTFQNVVTPFDGNSVSYGVCQVKLNTARMFNKRVHPSYLLSVKGNAEYAARYLAFLLSYFNNDVQCAVSAYSRGHNSKFTNCNTAYSRKVLRAMKERPWMN